MIQAHKLKLVYDVTSLPDGLNPSTLTQIYEGNNIVFWDSKKEGSKPQLYNSKTNEEVELALVDVKGEPIEIEQFLQQFADDQFWDKELHKCRQSPVYFFNNYKTKKWPIDNDELTAYLDELGLTKIVSQDSEEAKKEWEAQKAKRTEVGKSITVELLKELRPGVEEMVAHYNKTIKYIEEKYKDRLSDPKTGILKDEREKRQILIRAIKGYPIAPEHRKYRTKKNKWDLPMLAATGYDEVLKIFDFYQPVKTL